MNQHHPMPKSLYLQRRALLKELKDAPKHIQIMTLILLEHAEVDGWAAAVQMVNMHQKGQPTATASPPPPDAPRHKVVNGNSI